VSTDPSRFGRVRSLDRLNGTSISNKISPVKVSHGILTLSLTLQWLNILFVHIIEAYCLPGSSHHLDVKTRWVCFAPTGQNHSDYYRDDLLGKCRVDTARFRLMISIHTAIYYTLASNQPTRFMVSDSAAARRSLSNRPKRTTELIPEYCIECFQRRMSRVSDSGRQTVSDVNSKHTFSEQPHFLL
jgi:hypothetical protein